MSTADSQLLTVGAIFTNDFYKPYIEKKADPRRQFWVARIVIVAFAVLAWALVLAGLLLDKLASKRYGLPLRATAHVLLPFALYAGKSAAGIYGIIGAHAFMVILARVATVFFLNRFKVNITNA